MNVLHSRITRVEELVKAEVGLILLTELKDPRIGFLTVCRAKVSKDLSRALIFVSILDEEQVEEAMAVLRGARGFVRKCLSERLVLKRVPELEFIFDQNTRYADHVTRLLQELDVQPDEPADGDESADTESTLDDEEQC
jgi:ribosome-binding factor A